MGSLFKKVFNRRKTGKPGDVASGSQAITGIAPGDRGSNQGQGADRRLPGRRNPRTALGGPRTQQL